MDRTGATRKFSSRSLRLLCCLLQMKQKTTKGTKLDRSWKCSCRFKGGFLISQCFSILLSSEHKTHLLLSPPLCVVQE